MNPINGLNKSKALQQHLPFTVLKPENGLAAIFKNKVVATALTVYGIETRIYQSSVIQKLFRLQQHLPFTVLKR